MTNKNFYYLLEFERLRKRQFKPAKAIITKAASKKSRSVHRLFFRREQKIEADKQFQSQTFVQVQ